MAIVSHPLQTQEWTFPTITNNYEDRVASRKRGLGMEYEGERQQHTNAFRPNKKAKTMHSIENVLDASGAFNAFNTSNDVSHDPPAPHEYLAGDWKFEQLCEDTTPTEIYIDEDAPSPSPVDVEKVISILIEALQTNNEEVAKKDDIKPLAKPYPNQITSPLSGSLARVPYVRKAVGGPCRGRVEAGLQKWVLSRNHYIDICAYHPSRRSAEWIEALHEMGWENLHPTYMSQSQQTFKTLTTFSTSCDDWIDIDNSPEGQITNSTTETEVPDGQNLEGIHEDVWNYQEQVLACSRTTSVGS